MPERSDGAADPVYKGKSPLGHASRVLLLTASVAMVFFGTNLAVIFVDAMNVFWGFVVGLADVIQVVFAAIGKALLIALAIGAFVDLVIAAVYLGVSRRHAREA